jgi:hypothetical protein
MESLLASKQTTPTINAARSPYRVKAGNTAAANTTGLNAAIAAATALGGGVVYLPRGTIDLNALTTINCNNLVLKGQGRFTGGTELRFNNATGDCLTFSTSGHMGIEDVYITSNTRRTSGYALKFTGSPYVPTVYRVRVDYHYNGIYIDSGSQAVIEDFAMRYMYGSIGINLLGTVSAGIYGVQMLRINADNPYPITYGTVRTWATSTAYTAGQIALINSKIWQCSTSGTSSGSGSGPSAIPGTGPADGFSTAVTDGTAAWKFVCDGNLHWLIQDSYTYSVAIDQSALINAFRGVAMNDSALTGTSYPLWFDCENLEIDHSYSDCVLLSAGEAFHSTKLWAGSSLQGRGVLIDTGFRGEVDIHAGGRIVGNWLDGILYANGPTNFNLSGCTIALNSQHSVGTYHNVNLAASSHDVVINGNTIGRSAGGNGRAAYGVFGGASVARITITGNNLSANNTGNTNLSTTGTVIVADNQA